MSIALTLPDKNQRPIWQLWPLIALIVTFLSACGSGGSTPAPNTVSNEGASAASAVTSTDAVGAAIAIEPHKEEALPHSAVSGGSAPSTSTSTFGSGTTTSSNPGDSAGSTTTGSASPAPVGPSTGTPVQALPVLEIATDAAAVIDSKETYVQATYTLKDGASGATLHTGRTEIRGRGNFTWTLPKKPYRLRLATSTGLLSMPANRHWVLLANYTDDTLIRNDTAFELSRRMGMEWTPRAKHIEVRLNGSYEGVYQLVEQIRVGSNRVNIPDVKVSDVSGSALTGGYLIEIDETKGEDFCFDTVASNLPMCLNTPETLATPQWSAQKQYIQDYLNMTDTSIMGANFMDPVQGYVKYLDTLSTVHYYIAQELFRNPDGNLKRSTFLVKKRDDKLFFGPLWDFDIALGNPTIQSFDSAEGLYIATSSAWFVRLFQDPAFKAAVKTRWNQLKADGHLATLPSYIDERALYLDLAQGRNFQRWPSIVNLNNPGLNSVVNYSSEVSYLKSWLIHRTAWLDATFNAW